MSKRLALVFVLSVFAVAPARAEVSGPDWVSVRVTAGDEGATGIVVGIAVHAVTANTETQVMGIGFGGAAFPPGCNLVFGVGGGRTTVSSTVGEADVTLVDAPAGAERDLFGTTAFGAPMGPGESLVYTFYASGLRFSSVEVQATPATGSLTYTAREGNGTTLLRAAAPEDEGVAIGAGPVGAGSSEHIATLDTGIVGGWNGFTFCIVCRGTWKGPHMEVARSWAYDSTVLSGGGSCGFGGPAGAWSWSWSGVGFSRPNFVPEGEPAYGLYAPIGDDWVAFPG